MPWSLGSVRASSPIHSPCGGRARCRERSGLRKNHRSGGSTHDTPLPKSAAAAARCTPVGSSSSTTGRCRRNQARAGPGWWAEPPTRRTSTPVRWNAGSSSPSKTNDVSSPPSGPGSRNELWPSPVGSSRRRMATAWARTTSTSRSPALTDTPTPTTRRPGLGTEMSTASVSMGTGRMSSTVRRVTAKSGPAVRSTARATSAATAPPCWWRGSHGPRVCSVGTKSAPRGVNSGSSDILSTLMLLDHGDRVHDVPLADPLGDVDARGDVAEQVVRLGELGPAVVDADEELRPVGVGTGVGHRDGTERVLALHGLVGEPVAGPSPPGPLGITALDHELGHDPVERKVVVEALAGERHEVVDGVGSQLGIEVHDDVALVGGDRDLVGGVVVDLVRRGSRHEDLP